MAKTHLPSLIKIFYLQKIIKNKVLHQKWNVYKPGKQEAAAHRKVSVQMQEFIM